MTEVVVIAVVVLLVVGPHKLPSMLRSLGQWIRRLQQLTNDVRHQTGIDELLRAEGIAGLDGLRSMLRGDMRALVEDAVRLTPEVHASPDACPAVDPYTSIGQFDHYREYPPDGVDAAGTLPDDLLDDAHESGRGGAEAADIGSMEASSKS
jgi:sec-independent protein translocase protein TatB